MSKQVRQCESCGMPLQRPQDVATNDDRYCIHCVNADGTLKSKEEVREGLVSYLVSQQGKSRQEAEGFADQLMAQLPRWKS